MSSVGYSDLRDASYKALGLDPSFTDQSEIDASSLPGPPDALADGVSVSGAVVALIDLKLRSDPSKQQAWITITHRDDQRGGAQLRLGRERDAAGDLGGSARRHQRRRSAGHGGAG